MFLEKRDELDLTFALLSVYVFVRCSAHHTFAYSMLLGAFQRRKRAQIIVDFSSNVAPSGSLASFAVLLTVRAVNDSYRKNILAMFRAESASNAA